MSTTAKTVKASPKTSKTTKVVEKKEFNDKRLSDVIEKKGIIKFDEFEKMFGAKPSEILNKQYLERFSLRVTRLNGVKVIASTNKTQTVLTIIENELQINVQDIYELNQWNAHVVGSVFRKSARDAVGIEKNGKWLVKSK